MPDDDDLTILDTAPLWRRIHPSHIVDDIPPRLSSAAFKTRDEGLSIHLAELTSLNEVRERYPKHGVAEISAAFVRSLGLGIVRAPTEQDGSHAEIRPAPKQSNATKLANEAEVLLAPAANTNR